MVSDSVSQILLVLILGMSKKTSFHHHLVAQVSFSPPSTLDLPFRSFFFSSFSSGLGTVFYFFLAACDTGPPGLCTCFFI